MGVNKDLALSPPASPPPFAPCIILPHHLHHTTRPGLKGHAYEEITDEPIDEEEFWTDMGKVRVCFCVCVWGCLIYFSLWRGLGGRGLGEEGKVRSVLLTIRQFLVKRQYYWILYKFASLHSSSRITKTYTDDTHAISPSLQPPHPHTLTQHHNTHIFLPPPSAPPPNKQLHNIGLCLVYALVGFVPSFISTPLSVYLVHTLNAHPVIQNQISICMSLPWALKIFLGFTSDALPLCGERRRPYIFLGTLLWAGTFLYLSYLGNPSGPTLGLCLCLSTTGMVLCDTISDAMIVERSTKECEEDHGHLQSLVYAVRFGAAVVGAVLGGLVYNEGWEFSMTFGQILCVAGVLPLVLLLPSLGFVKDMRRPRSPSVVVAAAGEGAVVSVVQEVIEVEGHPPVSQQLRQIWDTVTLRVVFQPMAFIFIYNLFQVPNVSWNSFLQLTLGFTPVMLGALSFGGRLMTFVGILIYKRYFLRSSWRAVYVFSTVLLALLSVLQLLLIFQINTYLGISNFLFSLGDDVMSAFITGKFEGGREKGSGGEALCEVFYFTCQRCFSYESFLPFLISSSSTLFHFSHRHAVSPPHHRVHEALPGGKRRSHLLNAHDLLQPRSYSWQFCWVPLLPHLGRQQWRDATRRSFRSVEIDGFDLVSFAPTVGPPLFAALG